MTIGPKLVVAALTLLGAVAFAACGSSGDSARDDALAALDRATDAAGLEAEMVALVGDLPLEPTEKETSAFTDSLSQIDTQAGDILASADTGESYDEEIRSAIEQVRTAGRGLTEAANRSGLTAARKKAIADLKESNTDLRAAAGLIRAALEDEDELSAEDSEAFDGLLTDLDTSEQAVTDAGKEIATQEAEAEAAEQAAAEAAAAEEAASSSGGCPPGFELIGGPGAGAGGSCRNPQTGEQLPAP